MHVVRMELQCPDEQQGQQVGVAVLAAQAVVPERVVGIALEVADKRVAGRTHIALVGAHIAVAVQVVGVGIAGIATT